MKSIIAQFYKTADKAEPEIVIGFDRNNRRAILSKRA